VDRRLLSSQAKRGIFILPIEGAVFRDDEDPSLRRLRSSGQVLRSDDN